MRISYTMAAMTLALLSRPSAVPAAGGGPGEKKMSARSITPSMTHCLQAPYWLRTGVTRKPHQVKA